MAEAIAMKTCRTIVRENPKWALLNLALAILFVASCWQGLVWYIAWSAPMQPELVLFPDGKDYRIEQRMVGGAWLFLHFKTDPAPTCVRQAVHLLYQDAPGRPRDFFPLAAGLAGTDMPGSVREGTIRFLLPVGFPAGRWYYVYRAHYGCPPMELIPHTTSIGPTAIDVPVELGASQQ